MNLHVDRKTSQLTSESRRLWDDQRVWMVNCLVAEAAFSTVKPEELKQAQRARDRMLAAFIQTW